MEIAGAGIVEHVFGDVGYTEIQCFVFQDGFVGHRGGKGFVVFLLAHELVVVEVTLVDGIHVDEHQHGQDGEGNLTFQLALAIEEQWNGSEDDEQQAAHRVLAEDGYAHVLKLRGEVGVKCSVLAFAHGRKLLGFALAEEVEEYFGRDVEHEADACRDAQGDIEFLHVLLEVLRTLGDFGQPQETE